MSHVGDDDLYEIVNRMRRPHGAMAGDVLFSLIGEPLGAGIHRLVFAHRTDPTLVVKVQYGMGFENVYEARHWDENQYWAPGKQWLCPVTYISPNGLILLMRRATPLRDGEMPDKVPRFLTDLKASNFGWFEGRVVCTDYSSIITTTDARMKKVQHG